jgi:hypothetical protein
MVKSIGFGLAGSTKTKKAVWKAGHESQDFIKMQKIPCLQVYYVEFLRPKVPKSNFVQMKGAKSRCPMSLKY